MADNDIVPLTRGFVNQLVSVVKWARGQQSRAVGVERSGKVSGLNRIECVLIEDLEACDDPTGVPTSAKFVFLDETTDGTLQRRMQADGTGYMSETMYHRLNFGIPSGTYCMAHRVAGRWRPYAANCSSTELSASDWSV